LLGDVIVDRAEHTVVDVLGRLAAIAEAFAHVYYQIVQAVMPHCLPLSPRSIIDVSPTWYCNHSPSPTYSMSNHALIRLTCLAGIRWPDVRHTSHDDTDRAHLMEPSVASGAKIAVVNSTLVREHKFDSGRTRVDIG
jgi:hypothetical protein